MIKDVVANLEFDSFGIEDAQKSDSLSLGFAKQAWKSVSLFEKANGS
jgi:hypothetical protein